MSKQRRHGWKGGGGGERMKVTNYVNGMYLG